MNSHKKIKYGIISGLLGLITIIAGYFGKFFANADSVRQYSDLMLSASLIVIVIGMILICLCIVLFALAMSVGKK